MKALRCLSRQSVCLSRNAIWALGLASLLVFSGCGGGDNETPPSFDPIEIALVRVEPGNGESSVTRNRVIRLIFNTNVLPQSVTDQSILIRSGGTFQTRPEGTFLISANVVEFDPTVTTSGGANAIGFEAGAQVLIEIPLQLPSDSRPANSFLQNVEGNPISLSLTGGTTTSASELNAFTTGSGWDDPVPGPPGVLGLEFTPGPNNVGQVPSSAAVTVIVSEPINPGSVILGENMFLTNNTSTSALFRQDIPSVTFFDGSLTRITFLPVFGFGQGPFNVLVNFIDPLDPTSFTPNALPRDLAGNPVQNFTFFQTFDTQFDPSTVNTGLVVEDFDTKAQRDPFFTDAVWSDDPDIPFSLVSQPITTRNQNADIRAFRLVGGAGTDLENLDTTPVGSPPAGVPDPRIGEEDYCPSANPLLGPDAPIGPPAPPSAQGRRQLNLYRQPEVGGNGTIIRVAWGPDSDATFATTYPEFTMRLGHKTPGTSFANGLMSQQFDVNGFVTVVNPVTYSVPQSAEINGGLLNDGFLDWPNLDSFFDFDGVNDLIVDVEAQEGGTFQTLRNFLGVSQLAGGATCNCVTVFFGQCNINSSGGFRQADGIHGNDNMIPNPSPTTSNPSPAVIVMQFELAKLRSDARSRYYDTNVTSPDYLSPIINPVVQDGGATIGFTWSGSADGIIEDVPFTSDINAVDGKRFIRFATVMRANFFTGARSVVFRIEVPFTFVADDE